MRSMQEFAAKVALTTGGNAGSGRAIAVEFARPGAAGVIGGRREKEGLEVVNEIKATGGRVMRQHTPGLISSSPATVELLPSIYFSTSCHEV